MLGCFHDGLLSTNIGEDDFSVTRCPQFFCQSSIAWNTMTSSLSSGIYNFSVTRCPQFFCHSSIAWNTMTSSLSSGISPTPLKSSGSKGMMKL